MLGASFDGSLGCLENTRIKILPEIVHVLTTTTSTRNVFILSGPAGSGKTAIAHSVAHICDNEYGSLASSFFFKSGVNMRDRPDQLISSIAREFAGKNPTYASLVSEAIKKDLGLAGAPIKRQFHSLLHCLTSQLPPDTPPTTFVIDAIDEGWSKDLQVILESWAKLPSWIRLFVTFRDDGSVTHRFRSSPHIQWYDLDITSESNKSDIRTYIDRRLHEIAADTDYDLGEWPAAEDVDAMCQKAAGLFVWATVACSSIGDSDLNPIEQFKELVSDDVLRDTRAATAMDQLYLKVIVKCHLDDPRALLRYRECFGGVLCVKRPLSSADLNELLDVGHVFPTLRPLAPVLNGLLPGGSNTPIQITHGSLRHFATQENENYSIVERDQNASLALNCLRLIRKWMPSLAAFTRWITDDTRDGSSGIPTLPQNILSVVARYACELLLDHLIPVQHVTPELSNALELFIQHDLYGWLAVCAMLGTCQDIRPFLKWAEVCNVFHCF